MKDDFNARELCLGSLPCPFSLWSLFILDLSSLRTSTSEAHLSLLPFFLLINMFLVFCSKSQSRILLFCVPEELFDEEVGVESLEDSSVRRVLLNGVNELADNLADGLSAESGG